MKILLTVFAVFAVVLPVASARGGEAGKDGGTFRVAVVAGRVDTIDPALVDFLPEDELLSPACGSLMAYPDKPPPAAYRLVPSLAQSEPVVSRDGRTYTFTIRADARFSTGAAVTASSFSHALERMLTPAMKATRATNFSNIVGARAMLAGKATRLAGAVARGRTLVLRLKKQDGSLLGQLAGLCAVPTNLPADPEGAKAPLASAGPYYVAQYVPGERLVMERNRYYRGERPQHVTSFAADLTITPGDAVGLVASGTYDTLVPAFIPDPADLARRYGVNRSQFWVSPGTGMRLFFLNASRGVFHDNPLLRRAVNLAVDRTALAREVGLLSGTPTDQYLARGTQGFRDERIYPLEGDAHRARALAAGHTRGGKVVLYTIDTPVDVAQAQVLQKNLRTIGLELEVKKFPVPLFFQLDWSHEPWDLLRLQLGRSLDPAITLGCFFDGRAIGQPSSCDYSQFNSPKYNGLLDRASRLTGDSRYRAYGDLDVKFSRDAAPDLPVADLNVLGFVSSRVGCVVLNDIGLNLTAACLK